jgi:hypothetical protein
MDIPEDICWYRTGFWEPFHCKLRPMQELLSDYPKKIVRYGHISVLSTHSVIYKIPFNIFTCSNGKEKLHIVPMWSSWVHWFIKRSTVDYFLLWKFTLSSESYLRTCWSYRWHKLYRSIMYSFCPKLVSQLCLDTHVYLEKVDITNLGQRE